MRKKFYTTIIFHDVEDVVFAGDKDFIGSQMKLDLGEVDVVDRENGDYDLGSLQNFDTFMRNLKKRIKVCE